MTDEEKKRLEEGKEGDSEKGKITALEAKIEAALSQIEGLKSANTELLAEAKKHKDLLTDTDYLEYQEKLESELADEGAGSSSESGDVTDPNRMTGSQLTAHITKTFTTALEAFGKMQEKANADIKKQVSGLGAAVDVEIGKINNPGLKTLLSSEDGEKKFLALADENPTWGTEKLWASLEKDTKLAEVAEKEAEVAKMEAESHIDTEKGGLPSSIAEKDPMEITDDEAAEAGFKAAFGNKGIPSEESIVAE